MNLHMINKIFQDINKTSKDIEDTVIQIEQLKAVLAEKEKRNKDVFRLRFNELTEKESEIRGLMENKHFTYIKYIDFLNTDDLIELAGICLNQKSGFLYSDPLSRTPHINITKTISKDRKSVLFTINDPIPTNEVEFSFYSASGVPLVPESITLIDGDEEEEFFEPNFRYYNRNASDTFVSNYMHYPRKINKIKFSFKETFNPGNMLFNIYQNSFDASNNGYAVVSVENPNKLKTFSIYKNTDETSIPLVFHYSKDGLTYEEIKFDEKNTCVISQENASDFNIKITTDYENIVYKDEVETIRESINSESVIKSPGLYKLSENKAIESYDIILPFSSKKIFMEKCDSVELDYLNYIISENGVWKVKKEFINTIHETTNDHDKLKFYDDIEILLEDPSYFNFYLNTNTMELMTASFFSEMVFYIQHTYKKPKEVYNAELFTPYIFDISIKG